MPAVSPIEGAKYGFHLIVHTFILLLLSIIPLFFGVALMWNGSDKMGIWLAGTGFLFLYASMLGIGYKVIADAVKKGREESNDEK